MVFRQDTDVGGASPHTIIIARGEAIRHFTIGPRALVAGVAFCGLAALTVLALPVAYFLQDDIKARLEAHHQSTSMAYEERIAALRSQLDGLRSRQIIEQKKVATKVDVLLDQQEALTARYDRLGPLLEKAAATGLLQPPVPIRLPKPVAEGRRADAQADAPFGDGFAFAKPAALGGLRPAISDAMIGAIGTSIDTAGAQQVAQVKRLAEEARERTVRIEAALRAEHLVPATPGPNAQGGPYLPAPAGDDFDTSTAELEDALTEFQAAKALADTLPLDPPMTSELISSTFGVRSDPFLGGTALHSGVDYATPTGTPVRATAPGTVITASPSGGYGKMIEIDHGNGITTRYGHLSRIGVRVGQTIARGEQIGAAGSTGRSTGPHLHYEVRRGGEAVDPKRFFRIGQRVSAAG